MALLSVFDPDSTLLGRFHALLDPLDAFGTSMDIRIPEVSLLTFIGLLHGDGKAAVEVRPRIEEAFRVAAADAVLRTSRRIEVSAAALEDADRLALDLVRQLVWALVVPLDRSLRADDADFLAVQGAAAFVSSTAVL